MLKTKDLGPEKSPKTRLILRSFGLDQVGLAKPIRRNVINGKRFGDMIIRATVLIRNILAEITLGPESVVHLAEQPDILWRRSPPKP